MIIANESPGPRRSGGFDRSSSQDASRRPSMTQLETENRQLHQQLTPSRPRSAGCQGAIKYTVNSDLLFSPGSWEMKKAGKDVHCEAGIEARADAAEQARLSTATPINAPIGAGLKKKGVASNEELSQKRAESVMAFLVSQGVKQDLASAHGIRRCEPRSRRTRRPRVEQKNRRVELTLGGPRARHRRRSLVVSLAAVVNDRYERGVARCGEYVMKEAPRTSARAVARAGRRSRVPVLCGRRWSGGPPSQRGPSTAPRVVQGGGTHVMGWLWRVLFVVCRNRHSPVGGR
jgi:chemotaxis protein MotB